MKNKNELSENQNKYFRWLYFTIIATLSFYIFKYNFKYQLYTYNIVLLPIYFIIIILGPIYFKTRKYTLCASIIFGLSSFSAAFLIYTAGGIYAPGVFWLCILPFVGGILFGLKGSLFGGFSMFVVYISYIVLEYYKLIPVIPEIQKEFEVEKITNIFVFSFVMLLTTFYFLKNQFKTQQTIEQQKKEIEVLLKLLMHDVATPVTAIQGAINFISKKGLDPEVSTKYFKTIERCSQIIMNILSQARSVSAISDGKVEFKGEPTNVNELLQNTVEFVKIRAESKKIKFELDIDNSEPYIFVDHSLFKLAILSNLLTNSVKFSKPDSKIIIRSKQVSEKVVIEIQDFGIGIPKEILDQLFEIKSKTSRVGTNGEMGTGYGMPIMKNFVEKFNGQVEVTSKVATDENPESGTTFKLMFPSYKEQMLNSAQSLSTRNRFKATANDK